MSGGVRGEYPTRAVYPAVVLLSGGVCFAVVDYTAQPLEEPRDAARLGSFLAQLAAKGAAFEHGVLTAFGRTDLAPSPLDCYPLDVREREATAGFDPIPASTAAMAAVAVPLRPQLVRRTGERNSRHEYLVITGQT